MARIHFVVKDAAKLAYREQARREDKSLGEWLREAAEEKLAAARPSKFTVEELREFAATQPVCSAPGAGGPRPGSSGLLHPAEAAQAYDVRPGVGGGVEKSELAGGAGRPRYIDHTDRDLAAFEVGKGVEKGLVEGSGRLWLGA